MSDSLPRLRARLDLMPSPVPDRPGLLVRDPLRFTPAMIVVPPPLVPLLAYFDGRHGELDLKAEVVRLSGSIEGAAAARHLIDTLSQAGFLENATYERLRAARERAFAEAPRRDPAHAGTAYPDAAEPLAATLAAWLDGRPAEAAEAEPAVAWLETRDESGAAGEAQRAAAPGELIGVAAPHVSPEGGLGSYSAAYAPLRPEHAARTFVVLGTSHYGEPDRFGLTRKPYATPLGETTPDLDVIDELGALPGAAVALEDYCHAVEHSIEFQVLFLQQLYGPRVRVAPVLCGPFLHGLTAGRPEAHDGVARWLDGLARLAWRERERLFWVLGVDLAHVGRRYGDDGEARAGRGRLRRVAERDFARLSRLIDGDADGFWDDVRAGGDDALRWCGSSALYTFLRAVPARGRLRRYEQWNIDPQSVVSFGALTFHALPEGN
jgi:hypothetical protein